MLFSNSSYPKFQTQFSKQNFCLLSNDVERTSIWFNTLRDETGRKVLNEGMPKLLELYEDLKIKSTFFFTADIAKQFPQIVKMIIPFGHEVASHGKSHLRQHGFDVMSLEMQESHLRYSKSLLEDISGHEVISFRAPALRVNSNTAQALINSGFRIDSSIASQRFDMFMSFGSVKKLKWLFAHRLPYRTSTESLYRKGDSQLIEVPLSAFLLPYVGTTMRIFPVLTKYVRILLSYENSVRGKPIVFDIHPNEMIDESEQTRIITRRVGNSFSYFIQDWLRSQLKIKNLGDKALSLYKNEVKYFTLKNYKFSTLRDYCDTFMK